LAQAIAQGVFEEAKKQGYTVTVAIAGREGELILFLRGDGTHPHTDELARRKARTARWFRTASSAFAQRIADNPKDAGLATLKGVIAFAGGIPIQVAGETIGAVGVSGAPGGEKEEILAHAGLARAANLLK
jgi:uncharacterized protein GlcG (DUF336 family)